VFSVLSQAASGSGSFGQTADPKSINIALQGAFSSSETGATISRTQTINMLKEMMYRTCERYLNGQINEFEYPIIAARDQRIMTSILAIEQLTGTLLPKPVVIAGTGSASTNQSTNDVILSLDDAKKMVSEKEAAFDTAKKKFVEIDGEDGICAELMAGAKEDPAKLERCNEEKSNLEKAEKEYNDAIVHYNAIVNLAGRGGAPSAITSGILLSSSPTKEIDNEIEQVRSQAIQDVANVVKSIVAMSFRQEDETSFFCYRAITEKNEQVSAACSEFIMARVRRESARIELETEKIMLEAEETAKQMEKSKKLFFEKFWNKIKNESDQVDSAKLREIIAGRFPQKLAGPNQRRMDAMMQTNKKEEISKIFNTLPLWAINKLVED
jgi:hypothetical protein